MTATAPAASLVTAHVRGFASMLEVMEREAVRVQSWGAALAERLLDGHRLLVAGNGGSAAEAQHLTAELVGRFGPDRRPFSAIALNAETSSVTAIGNDYGFDEVFHRQVVAHARPGDIVLLLSTSGNSRNLIRAADAARERGALCWAMTGAPGNRLSLTCDDAVCLPGEAPHVQECQLILIHAMCRVFDQQVGASTGGGR